MVKVRVLVHTEFDIAVFHEYVIIVCVLDRIELGHSTVQFNLGKGLHIR